MAYGPFQLPRLILCEGRRDESFFLELIAARQLPKFHIVSPSEEDGGGTSGFPRALVGIETATGFDRITEIVIAADNDEEPDKNFKWVIDCISTKPKLGSPARDIAIPTVPNVRTEAEISATALMLPWAKVPGSLDSLCLEAASAAHATQSRCVEIYTGCVGADRWPVSKQAKMKLRSLFAGTHKKNPDIGFGNVWRDKSGLVPLKDKCFDQLADFLRSLAP